MKKILFFLILLSGCTAFEMPDTFRHRIFDEQGFGISVWEKSSLSSDIYHVYIEGDGNAFNAHGLPTNNPTPKSAFMRKLAAKDMSANVVYLARPCQFTQGNACTEKYWTTARFASNVVEAEYQAIKETIGNNPVILIGYSGGAQIAGLIASTKNLDVKEVITIAGNLDHKAWTSYHHLPPLSESMSLTDYADKFALVPQTHYVGEKDKVIPPIITEEFVADKSSVHIVPNATHDGGWDNIDLFE